MIHEQSAAIGIGFIIRNSAPAEGIFFIVGEIAIEKGYVCWAVDMDGVIIIFNQLEIFDGDVAGVADVNHETIETYSVNWNAVAIKSDVCFVVDLNNTISGNIGEWVTSSKYFDVGITWNNHVIG